jgi:hypothetical protein
MRATSFTLSSTLGQKERTVEPPVERHWPSVLAKQKIPHDGRRSIMTTNALPGFAIKAVWLSLAVAVVVFFVMLVLTVMHP